MLATLLFGVVLSACSVAMDEAAEGSVPTAVAETLPTAPEPAPATPATPAEPPSTDDNEKPTSEQASRFLMASTFGPTSASVSELEDQGYSDWFVAQLEMPSRSVLDASISRMTPNADLTTESRIAISEFYNNAVFGEDQLRVRAAYTLSQVFVISQMNTDVSKDGEGFAQYIDILQDGAFGNFRDLLEEVTYSPAMGVYLTYAGNQKANPATGSAPDENYAREIMQLFTIGLYELEQDGTAKLDGNGNPIETYSNDDITELAKVFTGLWWDGLPFRERRTERTQAAQTSRMVMTETAHSEGAKTFLGKTVPADLTGDESIEAALDILFEHPNTAPFISRLFIQRMTTSNPSPDYVRRVADAFDAGAYQLPNGQTVGSAERGDLAAVWAAILLDEEFLESTAPENASFGKIKEPVLRFTHWARMSGAPGMNMYLGDRELDRMVLHQHEQGLGQRAFTSPSVFNFYRPGYAAPGLATSDAGLVAPELQITTTTSIVSYANFMQALVFRDAGAGNEVGSFELVGEYADEIAIAEDPNALVEHLNSLLTAGTMSEVTKLRIRSTIESVALTDDNRDEQLRDRVQLAVLLAFVSPEFIVQQ